MQNRLMVVVLLSSLFLFFISSATIADDIDYPNKIDVKNISFYWKIDGDKIHIKLIAKTDGWVGIGFNPSKRMKDANFILGYVKDGKPAVTDHFGTGERKHETDKKLDGESNISNIFGKEEKGMTEIGFTIPLNSGDSRDKEIIVDQDTIVLLAYGSGRDSFKARHKFRTALTINLATGTVKKN